MKNKTAGNTIFESGGITFVSYLAGSYCANFKLCVPQIQDSELVEIKQRIPKTLGVTLNEPHQLITT